MLLFLFIFGLALGAVTPSDELEMKLLRGSCPMFWYNFNGRCYKYVASHMTWADAELHCVSEGANLVSIHSQEEHDFVNSLIKSSDPTRKFTWIGLTDVHKEGGWIWSDGSKVSFTIWSPGQPDHTYGLEHCVHTNWLNNFMWNEVMCSNAFAFVCASRTVCP
ncbi:lactose-binding lectin l-2-like [Melanotaenia boesemani]|uniref:lactose-binding lectin l-2-like n=1 Tax=Melanotaenia boesemani TaxID=1250792 RepID=UPI001C042618|nr:lactose-binding lectin l-2-like [Melanotaenia boesemani]